MTDQVMLVLDGLSHRQDFTADEDLVFPNALGEHLDGSALRRRFYATMERAALKRMRFHEYADLFVMPTSAKKSWRAGLIAA